jgi:hypothetical protein
MAHQADHAMAYEELKVIDAAWKVKNAHARAWRMWRSMKREPEEDWGR